MPQPALPTEAEIIEAAKAHGYLDEHGKYPPDLRRKLMNLALELRKRTKDIGTEFGKREAADLLEQDLHGTTIERIHDFYQDAMVAFGDDDRAFALALAVAPALVTRSGLHTDYTEGTAHDDDTTTQESDTEGEDISGTVAFDFDGC